jgi:hypothetical protein
MGINSQEVAYHFGQMGSAYLDDAGAFTPPTGKVIVAITVLSQVKFTTLTPSNDTGSNTYFAGTSVTAAATGNGVNAEAIASGDAFPTGVTIFGKWSACTLAAGSAILYFGEA